MLVVIHAPVNGVAGQSVVTCKSRDAPVLDPSQPTLRGNPQRTAHSESKTIHLACANPFGDTIRVLNSTFCEVSYTTLRESEPESVLRRIGD
jgi:hypothetical protein